MVEGSVYARQMPDGTYRFETDKPRGSAAEEAVLYGVRKMCVREDTVSASGKVATLRVNSDAEVKSFERKYPWGDEEDKEEYQEKSADSTVREVPL